MGSAADPKAETRRRFPIGRATHRTLFILTSRLRTRRICTVPGRDRDAARDHRPGLGGHHAGGVGGLGASGSRVRPASLGARSIRPSCIDHCDKMLEHPGLTMNTLARAALAFLAVSTLWAPSASAQPVDVVFLLDESGSTAL